MIALPSPLARRRPALAVVLALLVLATGAPSARAAAGTLSTIPGHPCLTPSGDTYDAAAMTCDVAPWPQTPFYRRVGVDAAMTGDGHAVYLVDGTDGSLIALSRGPEGALTGAGCANAAGSGGCADLPGTGASSVDTTSDGVHTDVYVGSDSTIAATRRDAAGRLAVTNCLTEGAIPGCTPTSGLRFNGAVFAAPGGEQVYTTGYQNIFVFQREPLTGALVAVLDACKGPEYVDSDHTTVPCDGAPIRGAGPSIAGIAFSPDGRSAYAMGQDGYAVLDRDPATGALTQKPGAAGCLVPSATSNPDGCRVYPLLMPRAPMAFSPDGRSVYLPAQPNGYYALLALDRDPATGELLPDTTAAGCYSRQASFAYGGSDPGPCTMLDSGFDAPQQAVVAPDGRHVYTLHGGGTGGRVQALRRDPDTGALSLVRGPGGCLSYTGEAGQDPEGVATECRAHHMSLGQTLLMDPEGRNLYAGADSSMDSGILELAIAPAVAPSAGFDVAPAAPVAGEAVTFTSTSTDADGHVVATAWDLDDDGAFEDASGPAATATFAEPGTYTVGIRVTDDDGETAVTARQVAVAARPASAPAPDPGAQLPADPAAGDGSGEPGPGSAPTPPAPRAPAGFVGTSSASTTGTRSMPVVVGRDLDAAHAKVERALRHVHIDDVGVARRRSALGRRPGGGSWAVGDVVAQTPEPGSARTTSATAPASVRLTYWTGDRADPRRCARMRAEVEGDDLDTALEEYREAGCPKLDVDVVPSRTATAPVVKEAQADGDLLVKVPTEPAHLDITVFKTAGATNGTGVAPAADDMSLTAGVRNDFGVHLQPRGCVVSADRGSCRFPVLARAKVRFDMRDVGGADVTTTAVGAWVPASVVPAHPGKVRVIADWWDAGDRHVYGYAEFQVVDRKRAPFTTATGRGMVWSGGRYLPGSAKVARAAGLGEWFTAALDCLRSIAGAPGAGTGAAQEQVVSGVQRASARIMQLWVGAATGQGAPQAAQVRHVDSGLLRISPSGVVAAGGGDVIAAGGANVIAAGGGNVVAAGGGSVIAAGGGNVIAAGRGTVIAAGGVNVVAPGGADVVAAGGGYVVAAGGLN